MESYSVTHFISVSLLCIFLLVTGITVHAQENPETTQLTTQIERVAKRHAAEEVYLQACKDIFEPGEDVWFKAYVLDARYLAPSVNTKTLYASLIKMPEKKAVWEEKYPVVNGFTDGHLYLPDTIAPGEYLLVAQTPLSVNPDMPAVISAKRITVIKDITALETIKYTDKNIIKPDSLYLQLLPEGGHLVAGITSRVAFKAVNIKGQPAAFKGTLYDGSTPAQKVQTLHDGMGSFFITPSVNGIYTIKSDSGSATYTLPQVEPKGQVIQLVTKNDEVLLLKVGQSTNLAAQKMYLRLQLRGVVYSMAQFTLKQEKLVRIPLDGIPQGIAEITLFNEALQPVAERLVFINDDKQIHLNATLNKTSFGNKEKVVLTLTATDDKGKPVAAHLGVAVADGLYHDPQYTGNIMAYCQLSAQMKGRVYNPAYYFDGANKNRHQALDLLLLTQGWRAYNWSEGNLSGLPLQYKPFVNDTLTGSIYAKKKKMNEVLGQQLVVSYPGNREYSRAMQQVDARGNFTVLPEHLQYPKRGYVYFKLMQDTDKAGLRKIPDPALDKLRGIISAKEISTDVPLMLQIPSPPIPPARLTAARNVNQLSEVVLFGKAKRKRQYRDRYMGTLDSLAKLGDYVCEKNVLNCINHPVGGRPPVEGQVYNDNVSFHPLPPYKAPYFTEDQLLEKFNLACLKGYYPTKEFYNPVYDADTMDYTGDNRNVLYWKPDVITNDKGVAVLEFFTSDISSGFRVVVEGVTGDGLLGSCTANFNVKMEE